MVWILYLSPHLCVPFIHVFIDVHINSVSSPVIKCTTMKQLSESGQTDTFVNSLVQCEICCN